MMMGLIQFVVSVVTPVKRVLLQTNVSHVIPINLELTTIHLSFAVVLLVILTRELAIKSALLAHIHAKHAQDQPQSALIATPRSIGL